MLNIPERLSIIIYFVFELDTMNRSFWMCMEYAYILRLAWETEYISICVVGRISPLSTPLETGALVFERLTLPTCRVS